MRGRRRSVRRDPTRRRARRFRYQTASLLRGVLAALLLVLSSSATSSTSSPSSSLSVSGGSSRTRVERTLPDGEKERTRLRDRRIRRRRRWRRSSVDGGRESEGGTRDNDEEIDGDGFGNRHKQEDDEEDYLDDIPPIFLSSFLRKRRNVGAVLDSLASHLLSTDSAGAVRQILKILNRSEEHGIVDVLGLHPPKDVVLSILALSRLQTAALHAGETLRLNDDDLGAELLSVGNDDIADEQQHGLLSDLCRYAVFANAAYGWKGGLFQRRLHLGDLKALMDKTGVGEEDVVMAQWHSRTHRPAYFIVRDVKRKKLVLCIRGTLSARDVLTDLCCTAEDFLTRDDETLTDESESESPSGNKTDWGSRARAHHGMLESARGVAKMAQRSISAELEANPDYDLVIVGHSLGGGTAAVLGTLWQDVFPGLVVYAYGCPCVGPLDAHPAANRAIVSVVGEGDPFSCLSLGHLADLSSALSALCTDSEMRDAILQRTKGKVENLDEEDLLWSYRTMDALRAHMKGEKLYPAGRIIHMGGAVFGGNGEVTLREVPALKFRDLALTPHMLDLSRHFPSRYEAALRRFWSDATGGRG